jgi:hypothetical protein
MEKGGCKDEEIKRLKNRGYKESSESIIFIKLFWFINGRFIMVHKISKLLLKTGLRFY